MRIAKLQLAGLLLGAMLVGSVVSVTAQEEPRTPTHGEERPPGKRRPKADEHRRRPGYAAVRHAIRGEFVVPGREEGTFVRARIDRGVLDSRDGDTLVVSEADGHVERIPVAEDTRISRDGERATVEDLQRGDHVMTLRVDEGDGFRTRFVRAISPERRAEIEEQRERCREDPERCRAERLARRAAKRDRPPPA